MFSNWEISNSSNNCPVCRGESSQQRMERKRRIREIMRDGGDDVLWNMFIHGEEFLKLTDYCSYHNKTEWRTGATCQKGRCSEKAEAGINYCYNHSKYCLAHCLTRIPETQ